MKQRLKFINKSVVIILTLSILGFFLRFLGQPDLPAGFHRDEAEIAYSAYSILETGRDDWGSFLPLHTKALGDYPPAFYNYLTALSISILGLNELAERIPAIIFGTFLIPLGFLLTKRVFHNKKLALLVAFIITFSPWDIVQSRAGGETVVALAFSFAAWIIWTSWIKNRKKWHLLAIGLLYMVALFSYNAVKLSLPLIQLLFVFYWWKDISKKAQALIFSISFILISLSSVYLLNGASDNFSGNNILRTIEPVGQEYFFQEGNMGVPTLISRIFHNKLASLTTQTIGNFGTFVGSNYLFFHAGQPGRYEVPGSGQVLIFLAPFLIIGLFTSTALSKKHKLLLLGWIIIGLIPAVVTTTAFPHVKRSMYFYFPLYVLIADGLLTSINYTKHNKLKLLLIPFLILGGIWSFGYFSIQYVVHTQYETILARDYGYREAYNFISSVESNYDQIQVFGSEEAPEVFYFFYKKIDPKLVQQKANNRPTNIFSESEEKRDWEFENYKFMVAKCPDSENLEKNILYFVNTTCLEPYGGSIPMISISELERITYPSGNQRFVILEKNI